MVFVCLLIIAGSDCRLPVAGWGLVACSWSTVRYCCPIAVLYPRGDGLSGYLLAALSR